MFWVSFFSLCFEDGVAEWSDWVTFSSDGSTTILFYLYNLCGPNDAYSYFASDSVTAWVSGTSENRYYFVNEVEINGDSSVVSTDAPSVEPSVAPSAEEETTFAPTKAVTTLVPAGSRNTFVHKIACVSSS